ncbi:hypothetical protein TTRE_0000774901 [Trichuris trichiura]|uniref:Uncharacterized protein n=1 Tax=Trichuris trichiura TaxID=36087 RepID=A0A077ZLA8_TRITR|nr:hypothetical protein TTRE_0000774901 [Trichuris trichiura]
MERKENPLRTEKENELKENNGGPNDLAGVYQKGKQRRDSAGPQRFKPEETKPHCQRFDCGVALASGATASNDANQPSGSTSGPRM